MSPPNLVCENYAIPAALAEDSAFVVEFRSRFFEEADSDIPEHMGDIIKRYNEGSAVVRETINQVFIWATGFSLTYIAACAFLAKEPAERRDDAALFDLMNQWAEKAEWKGNV